MNLSMIVLFSSHDENIKVLERIVKENTKDKIVFDKK